MPKNDALDPMQISNLGITLSGGTTRRGFLATGIAGLLSSVCATSLLTGCAPVDADKLQVSSATPGPKEPPVIIGTKPVEIHEGTNFQAVASPDGKTLAMDVLGIIWIMPIGGGKATQLTGYLDDAGRPDWAPDSKSIVFQSYRAGNFNLWQINADGSNLRAVTTGPYDDREPHFSPDGGKIIFASDRTGHCLLHTLDVKTGEIALVVDAKKENADPRWSPDGTRIAFSNDNKIAIADAQGQVQIVAATGLAVAPSWTRDGRGVIYYMQDGDAARLYRSGTPITDPGENVFPFPVSWLSATDYVYTADGKIKRRSLNGGAPIEIPFSLTVMVTPPSKDPKRLRDLDSPTERQVKGIAYPALSPDGKQAAFCSLNQLYLLKLGNAKPVRLTKDGYSKTFPAWSPDGKTLAYSTDRSGLVNIWLRDMATGKERQLTHDADTAFSATWSPDGTKLAFVTEKGDIKMVTVADGSAVKAYGPLAGPGRPTWSPDGKMIAVSAHKPFSSRFREGVSAIAVIDLASGKAIYHSPIEHVSLGPRSEAGPYWSADGSKMMFEMKSTLWVMPVDDKGKPTGAPVKLNNEVTDTPSWGAGADKILYLSNGKFRMIPVAGGEPMDVPMTLTWKPAKPAGTTVIHAGQMWNGRSDWTVPDVDIVIKDNRIVAVEPHKARSGVKWIDASKQTVLPGLMDMHTHRGGTAIGNREGPMLLAFGVTTTRSLSGYSYGTRGIIEAVDAGEMVGPRYFGAGECIDGGRIAGGSGRAVYDMEQLELELQRTVALDYELIKTYVRLPLPMQKRVNEFGRANGIRTTSHYLFPAVAFGADAKEHMYGTHRLGNERMATITRIGNTYQDVVAVQTGSGAALTPTLFGVDQAKESPEIMDQPRVKDLFPKWEYDGVKKGFWVGSTDYETRAQVETIKKMIAGGVTVVTGTDTPVQVHAVSMHYNLRLMVKYGMTPAEALRTATTVPGDYMGQGMGAIEPGMLADLIVVDGNPLQNINDLINIKLVMVGGLPRTVDELVAPYLGKEGAGGETRSAENWVHPAAEEGFRQQASAELWWHHPDWVGACRSACCAMVRPA